MVSTDVQAGHQVFLGVNFCPGIRYLGISVTFHKRVNNKWST